VDKACAMLASGKKRVCCFDPSGYYSKSLNAPEAADGRKGGVCAQQGASPAGGRNAQTGP
jgi:hypothetical protein